MAAPADQIYRAVATALDSAFYRATYPDVAAADYDPVRHYVETGWMEGRDPAPWFSTAAYLARNPDVAGINPFHHYLTGGWREGREAEASEHRGPYLRRRPRGRVPAWRYDPESGPEGFAEPADEAPSAEQVDTPPDPGVALMAEAFDATFYRAAYPDVAEYGADPFEHFVGIGWREGRDPCRAFSVGDYLELNPDVAEAGINPFLHYLQFGRAEGRLTHHELGFRHHVISRLVPLAQHQAHSAHASARQASDSQAKLVAGVETRRGRGLHITFSHDDFTQRIGGLQLCLQREAAALAQRGTDHLHLFPATSWPTIRPDNCPAVTGVLWNGVLLGAFTARDIAATVRALLERDSAPASFAIHNLLGHAVGEVLSILRAGDLYSGYFWLHDFTSLCAGFHLMRDDVVDCGAPPPDSQACTICVYGPQRALHMQGHDRLFSALDLTVVAPSQLAYDTWRRATTIPAGWPHRLHPHARLLPLVSTPPAPLAVGEPLTVAFLGVATAHKGWPIFVALAERFAGDPRFRFLHLAASEAPVEAIAFHRVSVTAGTPRAMLEAIDALKVDVAMLWSLCRETFSFTAYEAVAQGCAILTGPDSGNIAALVAEGGHGRVLADEAELARLFESGEVLALARAARGAPAYDLAFSALTVDLLEEA